MSKELEKSIHRIEIHKDYARLTNGTCIVNKQDLETVLKELRRLQEDYIAKDKIREIKKQIGLPNIIVGGRRNAKTLEYGKRLGKIELCKELLEEK